MKAHVTISLKTDGDFSLRKDSPNFERFGCKINYWPNTQEYDIYATFDVDKYNAQLREFLKTVLCEIHVSPGHYYLLKELYSFFVDAIDYAWYCDDYYESLGGNYSGTYIDITYQEEQA